MIRKLLLLAATAVAAFAFSASAASAVIVENPGMHEIESEVGIAIGVHTPIGFIAGLSCDNEWEANVSSTGAVEVHDITLHQGHANQVGPCDDTDDCDNAGWHNGQIEEVGLNQFEVHITFCLEGQGGQFDGVDVPVECPIYNTEVHCDYTIGSQETPFGISPVEVLGEMTFHDSLGLMHEVG